MLLKTTATTIATPPLSSLFKPSFSVSKLPLFKPFNSPCNPTLKPSTLRMSWLNKLGFGARSPSDSPVDSSSSSIAQGPDDDIPAPGQQFAQFGAGCFWGVELAFQRVPGVTKTEVGYTQGAQQPLTTVLNCLHSFTASIFNRQVSYAPNDDYGYVGCSAGNDVGTQYRSGIYFYTPEQEKAALESKETQQKLLNRKIVTEILPAKKFYRAEEYHQQYLAKGGRFGFRQSSEKGCNDPIRCYG
ncbi:UNVERIFIED_CONTAM: Peptide methionine sulfoxide reductase [Sesamum calycinum]|uniref:peptide-methionine (S)-S-oxide reductase n=1 Tax=Sesamum calycinum TaxID=2727403 RepID=A0AAW2LSM6_9LAMI